MTRYSDVFDIYAILLEGAMILSDCKYFLFV
jgi:hypothetical protein